ncbi:MAG: L,D-transpeptidase [Desulfarculaceae bacterium]|nr:L,D-transpeptidase [Desulfarculaceae bacterium]
MIRVIEARSTRDVVIVGIRLFIFILAVFTLCSPFLSAQAAQAPDVGHKRLTPLDSTGQPVVWCYHGQAPDTRLVVVDKSRQRLMVLRYLGKLALEFEYPCASGERSGPKIASRDEKTPEGIYFVTKRFKDNKITVFGDRALHLNYPNPQDLVQGRNGDGIYIHGTNRDYKPRSSNGCLVMANHDLASVGPLVNEQFTPVIVVGRMALADPSLQAAACEFLRTVNIDTLSRSAANLPNGLELLRPTSAKRELPELASKLEGLDSGIKVRAKGLALFGTGSQWVLLANQEITGPGGKKVRATRRFYLSGQEPASLKLVQSQWVLPNLAGARLLASWAQPKIAALASVAAKQSKKKAPAQDQATLIKPMLDAWISAWQNKQLNQYMSFYAKDFRGSGKNRRQWRRHKSYLNRTYKKITVRIQDLKIEVKGNRAMVSFIQRYSSDWHSDLGVKHLQLIFKDGRWLIRSEAWQKMPSRSRAPA